MPATVPLAVPTPLTRLEVSRAERRRNHTRLLKSIDGELLRLGQSRSSGVWYEASGLGQVGLFCSQGCV
jgi:hypothetical protein